MTDILAKYSVTEVAAWYGRLAAKIEKQKINGNVPLASRFLRAYLDNRNPKALLQFSAPVYLINHTKIKAAQVYHRRVFLTEEKARIGKTRKWAGIIPRLQDGRWNGTGKLSMTYQSLVEIGGTIAEITRIQLRGSEQERDLFTSLRGFQLHSNVTVTGTREGDSVAVKFGLWRCKALDRYDWNYNEHLTVPNPDYKSTAKGAIRPDLQKIRVYHKNAKRLEDAKLAAPYNLEVGLWCVNDTSVTGPATVDAGKKLR
ncbi:hypothetical protein [Candidatus Thiosymbion oneisti]|uniref:hypothetical protein n=1 Tax=Candidatus Thiosymbion oneisti TaxID=589554 RepID=UPI000AA2DE12|nr:hypothetical protein [Candidatus Thiosymbion oneisti]